MGTSIAGILAAVMGLVSGERRNRAQAKEASKQRDFQSYMSSTAHQRQMQDLKLAGLNPILASTGGASSPGGAQATVEEVMTPALSTALQSMRTKADINLIRAQEKNVKADTGKKGVEAAVLAEEAVLRKALIPAAETEKRIETSTFGKGTRWLDRAVKALFGNLGSAKDAMRERK